MARKKKAQPGAGDPPWLITFSDLMTLLLTFFVLLLSMSVIDERAKLIVLGSVTRTFGAGKDLFNPLAKTTPHIPSRIEPGAMEDAPNDLAPLRDMIFDDVDRDLAFKENKYVQIFSINDDVLFEPGGYTLSEQGMAKLDRILPYLQRIKYPLLIAGHASVPRDETPAGYTVRLDPGMDNTWFISFRRALAVYRHLASRGINPERLSLEAFGQFRPLHSNNTPEGRRKNRRVDLVLDKRNLEWIEKVEELREEEPTVKDIYFKGFKFDLNMPDTPPGASGRRP
ncbi:MAG: OmpA family protein [Desulfovibrionaceae bacterium]|nr:OmpA family protein [Desulfovibrionaceae bacterium]